MPINLITNGTSGNDTITLKSGNNNVSAGAGNDAITTGSGNDIINAGDGNDTVNSGAGNDVINAGSGSDNVSAGSGNDTLIHNIQENIGSSDFYSGGTGTDTLVLQFTELQKTYLISKGMQFRSDGTIYIANLAPFLTSSGNDQEYNFNTFNGTLSDGSAFTFNLKITGFEKVVYDIIQEGVMNVNEDINIRQNTPNQDFITSANMEMTSVQSVTSDANLTITSVPPPENAIAAYKIGAASLVLYGDGTYSLTQNGEFNHLAQGEKITFTINYTVEDARYGPVSTVGNIIGKIQIMGTNDAPIAVNHFCITGADEAHTFIIPPSTLLAGVIDPDDGAQISLLSVSGNSHISLLGGNVIFTPGSDFSYLSQGDTRAVFFQYTIKDQFGATSTANASLLVNGIGDSSLIAIDHYGITGADEDHILVMPGSVLVAGATGSSGDGHGDRHDDGEDCEDKGNNGEGSGVISLLSISGDPHLSLVNGNVIFTPGNDFQHMAQGATQTLAFKYTIKDELGTTSTANASLIVHGLNDAPVAIDHLNIQGADEDHNYTILASTLLTGATDVDDGAVLRIASIDSADSHLSLVNGNVLFTPGNDFNHLAEGATQTLAFTYTVTDEFGATSTKNASLVVKGLNDAPVAIDHLGIQGADGNTNLVLLASTLLQGATDPDDGAILRLKSISGDPHVTILTDTGDGSIASLVAVTGDSHLTVGAGNIVFNPGNDFNNLAPNQTAVITFQYTIEDELAATATANASLIIKGAPLVAVNGGTFDVDEDHSAVILASTLVPGTSGSIVFSPGQDFQHMTEGATQVIPFQYTIKDVQGNLSTANASFIVHGLNDAPVAIDHLNIQGADEDHNYTILASTLLTGATDVDDGAVLRIASIDSADSHLSLVNGNVLFTPGNDFNHLAEGATQTLAFTYTVTDEFGATSTKNASLVVKGLNDAPVAIADNFFTTKNTHLTSAPGSILLNDIDVDDGSVLEAILVTGTAHGSLTLNTDGSFTYIPITDYIGLDAFTYKVNDRFANSNIVTNTILVTDSVKIATYADDCHVLCDDGTVWAWGWNVYGQLGDGTTVNKSTAVEIKTLLRAGDANHDGFLDHIVSIGSGSYHSLALREDGTVWSWGRNNLGQLGDGTTIDRPTAVEVKTVPEGAGDTNGDGFLDQIVSVDGGFLHSVAVRGDGSVWAWGLNSSGQLGDGTTANKSIAVEVKTALGGAGDTDGDGFLDHIIKAGAGQSHSLALRDDGTVWDWGSNNIGQLGDGTTANKSIAVEVKTALGGAGDTNQDGFLDHIMDVSSGASHNLALRDDGSVWAWGYNLYGRLGDGTTVTKSTAVEVKTLLSSGDTNGDGFLDHIISVAAGPEHSLAVRSDGTVWAWGSNGYGRLGDGTTIDRFTAVEVKTQVGGAGDTNGDGFLDQIVSVDAGAYHSIALRNDGTVWTWGRNDLNQLGDGTTIDHSIAVQVPNFNIHNPLLV